MWVRCGVFMQFIRAHIQHIYRLNQNDRKCTHVNDWIINARGYMGVGEWKGTAYTYAWNLQTLCGFFPTNIWKYINCHLDLFIFKWTWPGHVVYFYFPVFCEQVMCFFFIIIKPTFLIVFDTWFTYEYINFKAN